MGWDHVNDVIPVVKSAMAGDWKWYQNSRCKYIDLRIDMRDGSCIIRDRHREIITPDELRYQCTTNQESQTRREEK